MKKNPKEAFGIHQDGMTIRMVHLKKEGGEAYLLGMDFLKLERDWYKGDQASAADPHAEFIPSTELELDSEDFDFTDFSNLDSEPESPPAASLDFDAESEAESTAEDDLMPATDGLETSPVTMWLSKYPMGEG